MNSIIKEITADDAIFTSPEFEEDKALFNYIESSRKNPTTRFFSDQKHIIICHKKDHNSVWIWTDNEVKDDKDLVIGIATTIRDLGISNLEFFTKPDIAQMFSDLYALVSCELNYLVKSEFSLGCYVFDNKKLNFGDEVTVLKYNKKYLDAILEFYKGFKEEFRWDDETLTSKVRKFVTLDTYLLLKHNEIISVCVISHDEKKSSSVRSIATKQSERNNGYGTIALNAACTMSSNSSNNIMIYANNGNHSAIKTISKAGFIHKGDIHLIKS